MSELHQAARALAERGMAVMPVQARDKVPATSHGVHDATTDPATIDDWWRLIPDANIGVACGVVSGIFVLDIDGEDGEATIRGLEAEHGPAPSTIEVITGQGRHCYFRLGDHGPVGNTAGRIGPGIDTRGDGGYVLAPPSIHPSGRRYEWSVDTAGEFADAPDWLHEKLAECASEQSTFTAECLDTGIGEGTRNDTLARITGHLLRRGVEPRMARALVLSFNQTHCAPSLPDDEAVAVIESIARLEARRRGLVDG